MKKTNRIVVGIISAIALAGIVGALGYVSKGFKNWNVKEWIPSTSTPTPPISEPVPMPANLLMKKVGDTVRLIATVLPVDATDKRIEWSSSLPDVISITPISTGSNVADIKLLKAFEGHCILTAKTMGGNFTKTCDITFAQRPTSLVVKDSKGIAVTDSIVDYNVGSTATFTVDVLPTTTRPMYKDFNLTLIYDDSKMLIDRFNPNVTLEGFYSPDQVTDQKTIFNTHKDEIVTVTKNVEKTGFSVNFKKSLFQVDSTAIGTAKHPMCVIVEVINDGSFAPLKKYVYFDIVVPTTGVDLDKPSYEF